MPLYKCNECGCIENTAVGSYWGKEEKLCSECSTGEWHGKFEKRSAVGMHITRAGFLYGEPNEHHNADFRTIRIVEDA